MWAHMPYFFKHLIHVLTHLFPVLRQLSTAEERVDLTEHEDCSYLEYMYNSDDDDDVSNC